MSTVTVVIPCFNAAPYLADCLACVCGQTLADIDIVLVDDGSTDESGALADAWAAREPRLRVLHQPNAGVSAARNAGLAQATGTYVCFVDADDTLTPGALAALHAEAEAARADITSALHAEVYADGTRRVFTPGRRCARREQVLARLIEGDSVYNSMCNKLYRRALLAQWALRADPGVRIGEDALFNLEAYARAARVAHLPRVTYLYRIHSASAMRAVDDARHYTQHLPWLNAMRALLTRLGLRERFFRAYCYSHVLRLYKERRFTGVLRGFAREVRPAVLEGIAPARLPRTALPLYALVRLGLFPAAYCVLFPAQVLARQLRKAARYVRHFALRVLDKGGEPPCA